jgi:hypothetical protein
MSSRQNNTGPVLERQYLEEPDACVRALALLLGRRAMKDAVGKSSTNGDDGTAIKEDSASADYTRT